MIGVSRLNVALGSLVGVCALQPGLGGVFSDLIQVQPGSSGMVYIREMPELVGRQHRQIWRAFTDAVVTGYLHQPHEGGETCDLSFTLSNGRAFETGGRLVLNPEEEYVMQPGDRLVVVSPSDQRVTEHLPAAASHADADICVSGDLLLNAADVAPSGSDIVLICCENILKTVLERSGGSGRDGRDATLPKTTAWLYKAPFVYAAETPVDGHNLCVYICTMPPPKQQAQLLQRSMALPSPSSGVFRILLMSCPHCPPPPPGVSLSSQHRGVFSAEADHHNCAGARHLPR